MIEPVFRRSRASIQPRDAQQLGQLAAQALERRATAGIGDLLEVAGDVGVVDG